MPLAGVTKKLNKRYYIGKFHTGITEYKMVNFVKTLDIERNNHLKMITILIFHPFNVLLSSCLGHTISFTLNIQYHKRI